MIVARSSPSWTDAGAVTISFPTSKPKSVSPSFVKAQPLIQTLTGAVGDSSVTKTSPHHKTVFVIQPNCSADTQYYKAFCSLIVLRQGIGIHRCPLPTMVDLSSGSNSTNEVASGAKIQMLAVGQTAKLLLLLQILHWLHTGTLMAPVTLTLVFKDLDDPVSSISDQQTPDTLVFCLFPEHTMFLWPRGHCICHPSSGTFLPSSLSSGQLTLQFLVNCPLKEPSLTTFSEVAPPSRFIMSLGLLSPQNSQKYVTTCLLSISPMTAGTLSVLLIAVSSTPRTTAEAQKMHSSYQWTKQVRE